MRALTSTALVKSTIGQTSPADDALITSIVAAVSEWIPRYCGTSWEDVAAFYDLYNGNGGTRLYLRRRNITSITAVIAGTQTIPLRQSLTDSGWSLDPQAPRIPILYLVGYTFPRGIMNVSVAGNAGVTAVPGDIANAALALSIWHFRELRDHPRQKSKSLGQQNISFSEEAMPAEIRSMLDLYRVVTP
jgi:hypothetical protein